MADAPLADDRIIPLGQVEGKGMDVGRRSGGDHLGLCGVHPAIADVVAQRAVKQVGLLENHGDLLSERAQGHVAHILAVDPPPAGADIRRLINLGQIVQSNALSFFHLSSPDLLFGFDADPAVRHIVGVAQENPQLARDGIALRKWGQQIIERLGDVTPDEIAFVRREFEAPLDAQGFVRSVPRGMEQEVYVVSLMAIDLDHNAEAQYLHELAQGFGMRPEACNQIHQQLGAPALYR